MPEALVSDGGDAVAVAETGTEVESNFDSFEDAFHAAEAAAEPTETSTETESGDDAASLESEQVPEDQLYTVKVDGEELQVTLDEALKGYQRQAVFTRKTQALSAEQARLDAFSQLEDAFKSDPSGTVAALARLYEVPLVDPSASLVDPELEEPWEKVARELRQEIAQHVAPLSQFQQQMLEQQQQAESARRVEAEVASVKDTFGVPDLDEYALMQYAVDNEIGSLEKAFRAMRDEGLAPAPAVVEQQPTREEQVAERKRTAPPVEGGSGSTQQATVLGASEKMTFKEAALAAMQSLGR